MTTRYQEDSLDGPIAAAGDRAVSPVIGVVLMIVLAVSLAAVVGGLTSGMVEQASLDTAPKATITASNDAEGEGIRMAHDGGEDLAFEDLTVIVREVNGPEIPQEELTITENGTELSTGNTFLLDSTHFDSGTEYEVVIVDDPSGEVIDRAIIEYRN